MVFYSFNATAHTLFTQLSGDGNPIHTDPLFCRRTQAGMPIVHGIHSLLILLESLSGETVMLHPVTGLKVRFRRPIYIGETVRLEIVKRAPGFLKARISIKDVELVSVRMDYESRPCEISVRRPDDRTNIAELPRVPVHQTLDQMKGVSGSLSLGALMEYADRLFPLASRYFGVRQIATLLGTSSIVGMIVPGLHSLFTGLDVSFIEEHAIAHDSLQFRVSSIDPRFRLVRIWIRGGSVAGHLEAASIRPPVMQPMVKEIAALVTRGEFSEHTALIIGGSRGLGELTAKLVSSGGARVVITYASGKSDADSVRREIQDMGGECAVIAFDARREVGEQLTALGGILPTHLYYFATTQIATRRSGVFDYDRFMEFSRIYLKGFIELVQWCATHGSRTLSVFYPSSAFVESGAADLMEYAMAKSAGEILCKNLQECFPKVRFLARRLPRLATDQTNTILEEEAPGAVEVMLPIVREMHS